MGVRTREEKAKQNVSPVKPMTLNLQTRPFAPIETEESEPVKAQNTSNSYKNNQPDELLRKSINFPIRESASIINDVVQRHSREHFGKIRAKREFASMQIQAKLNIGKPNDKYEKEADDTAAKVVQQINSSPQRGSVQKQESLESEDEELQTKSLVQRRENLNGGEASTDLESSIQNARAGGQSLDPNLQAQMGQAMGADFSGVKVHTDSHSDQLNKSIQAKAFTTGQDVFFRKGAYEPRSQGGQELIAHELTHVMQQNGGAVQRSPLKDIVQRDDTLPLPTVGGYGSDSIEGGGNFLEFLDDAVNAIAKVNDPNSSTIDKGISGSKALGSLTGTVVAGLKANEIETMTSCLEAMSEGMKIFDAGKEVWETVRKVDFWNDTTMQTFNNVWMVIIKLGDLIVSSTKIANAFVSSMEWATGRLKAFSDWLPISELIVKCAKFLNSVKQWIFAYNSYHKLKLVQSNISDPNKQKQVGYLVDEQWSRLKNGAVPISSTGVDFASETAKYFPSLGINIAITASLGTASKALPIGHKVMATGYDYVRQGWRNIFKYVGYTESRFAAIDKADLNSFRNGLVDFVLNERNQTHGLVILESLGLGANVQTMGDPDARDAIEDAVKDIK